MFVDPTKLLLYKFYSRYNWLAADFTAWQDGMIAMTRGAMEGLVGASILDGFAITLTGGMGVEAGTGIALGPSGYIQALDVASSVSVAAPTAGTTRNLIVIQPQLVNGTMIQDPIDANKTDVLTVLQEAVVAVIAGVAANSPVYPAVPAGATVLCGIRATTGQTVLATSDIDLSVQDNVGKNSLFDHNIGVNDDRLRPYRSTNQILGIKPSQIEPPGPRLFTYINAGVPSIYPKSGGLYNPADTLVNFQTGAITGGDATTPDFTPTIPGAGQAIVAAVGVTTADLLAVSYGTAGTRAQCYAAIKNQTTVGAGSLTLPTAKLVSFVILYSADGANINELDLIDARSFGTFIANNLFPDYDVVVGAVDGATHATLAAAVADGAVGTNKRVLLADSQAIAPVSLTKAGWKIVALPGVTYSKASGTTGISVEASDISISGLRLSGYSTAGNKAITGTSGWQYGRVFNCNFSSCDTEVDTSSAPTGKKPVLYGNITE